MYKYTPLAFAVFLLSITTGPVNAQENPGDFIDAFAEGNGLDIPLGLVFGPDGNLYVSSWQTHSVYRFDGKTGDFVDVFVAADNNLMSPTGLTFGPDGHLYISSYNTEQVLRYDGATGAFVDVFAQDSNLDGPETVLFGPDGHLYVASRDNNQVVRFDGSTGAFVDVFAQDNTLVQPVGLAFGPDGNLYVGSHGTTDQVLRFNGETGALIDEFTKNGGLNDPHCFIFGPNGDFYVSNGGFTDEVVRFDGTTGEFKDVFARTGGLLAPAGMAFGPDGNFYVSSWETDQVLRYVGVSTQVLQVLNTFYKATGGSNWTNNANWFSGPLANWHGLTVDGENEVTAISLPSNNLTGTLSLEVNRLPALMTLNVSGNELTGNIPDSLNMISTLRTLDVSANLSMSGTLPITLVDLPLTTFAFDNTGLCENLAPEFQSWLSGITTLSASGCTNVATEDEQPQTFALHQNYPNPFNPETQFLFDLPEASVVKLVVYSAQGKPVAEVVNGTYQSGSHQVNWRPQGLSSGVYFYRLEAGKHIAVKKLLFVK